MKTYLQIIYKTMHNDKYYKQKQNKKYSIVQSLLGLNIANNTIVKVF